MYCGKDLIGILGTSALNLGATINTLLENTDKMICILTQSERYETVDEIVNVNNHNLNYSVYYPNNNVKDLEQLISIMRENRVRVAIINVNNPIYNEVIRNKHITTWFSACRNDIFIYLQDMLQVDTGKRTIVSLDNDYKIATDAQAMCKGSNIQVVKAIAHCVCRTLGLSDSKTKLLIDADNECEIVFPPEVYYFRNELTTRSHMLARRTRLIFTSTPEEFSYWNLAKYINSNSLHTLIITSAFLAGFELSLSFEEISEMRIDKLLDFEPTFRIIKKVHRSLFQKYMAADCELYGDDYELHYATMERFVKHLFASENVRRGFDISKPHTCASKIRDHFPLLKSTGDEYVIHQLESFEKIYNAYLTNTTD